MCECVYVCVCVCQGANGQLEGITSLATGITGTSHTNTRRHTHVHAGLSILPDRRVIQGILADLLHRPGSH